MIIDDAIFMKLKEKLFSFSGICPFKQELNNHYNFKSKFSFTK